MKVLQTARGMGKTDALVNNFISKPGWNKLYIVSRYAEKQMIQNELTRRGFQDFAHLVFTTNDIMNGKHLGLVHNPYVLIDNLDHVLQDLIQMPVAIGTIS